MEKPKRKAKENKFAFSWLRSLFGPERFDFDSPLGLEECADHLRNLDDYLRSPGAIQIIGTTKVQLFSVGETAYEFIIRKQLTSRSGVITATGHIEGTPGMPTKVIGEVESASLWRSVVILLVGLLFIVFNPRVGVLAVFVVGIIGIALLINIYIGIEQREGFARSVEKTLFYKAKREKK